MGSCGLNHLWRWFKIMLLVLLPLRNRLRSQASNHRQICQFKSTSRRVSSAKSGFKKRKRASTTFGRIELNSHADTIVAGSNCVILQYTGKECDVSPYRDDYESVSNVPIVHAAALAKRTFWCFTRHCGWVVIWSIVWSTQTN